jgi:ABC-type transporter Mla subunit MlaD
MNSRILVWMARLHRVLQFAVQLATLIAIAYVIRQIRGGPGTITYDVGYNLGVLSSGMLNLNDAITDEHKAIAQQGDALAGTLKQIAALLGTARDAIGDIDADAKAARTPIDNAGTVLSTFNDAIGDQNTHLMSLEDQGTLALTQLTTAITDLQPVLTNAAQAAAAGVNLANDPNLKQGLARLNTAIGTANDVLGNLDKAAASGDRSMEMIEAKIREALKPASLAKTLLERALGVAGPAAQIATAAK